jgi:biopolymer transport protein ExbD
MSRRRKKKKRESGEVELNLAAMLDMAFQLLAFFILTFKPSAVEGQINLTLPPPMAVTNVTEAASPSETSDAPAPPGAKTMIITVTGRPAGQVESVTVGLGKLFVGPADPVKLRDLDQRLKQVFLLEGTPFDQVLLRVGKDLAYGELMKIVEVCTRQKMADGTKVNKISFVEIEEKQP